MSLRFTAAIGYDYSRITNCLGEYACEVTAKEVAEATGLSLQRIWILLNTAAADGVVNRRPYAGKNRADLWRLA